MSSGSPYDMSAVGPHRRAEVLRRIRVLDAYLAGEIASPEAIAELGLSVPTFWRLLRVWRQSKRPDLIGASGRERKSRIPVTPDQKKIIEEVERTHPQTPIKQLAALCLELAAVRGVEMPGGKNIRNYAGEYRRSHGLRPPGVHDIILGFCAIDIPIEHPEHGVIAPIMSILLDVGEAPIVLGLSLTLGEPTPALAARTVLDGIARADCPRITPARLVELPLGTDPTWQALANATSDAGLPTKTQLLRPRSGQKISALLGKRPAGIVLFPNLTARTAGERIIRMRPGDPISLENAETMLKARLARAFPGMRMAITNDAEARGRLSARLHDIAIGVE